MHAKQMQALDPIPEIAGRVRGDVRARVGRPLSGYRTEDAETVVLALGSVLGTIQDVVDELRDDGVSIGALGMKTFRPYPLEEVRDGARRRQAGRGAREGLRHRRRRDRRPERAARPLGHADHRVRRGGRSRRAADHQAVAARAVRRRGGGPARAPDVPRHGLGPREARAGTHAARAPHRAHTPRASCATWGPSPHGRTEETPCPTSRSSSTKQAASWPAIACCRPRSARCRRARSARTRSPRATGPARDAARRWAPATPSTPRCAPRTGS